MGADKGKKAKLDGEANEQQIYGDLVLSIEKLQKIQGEFEKVNEEASDKVLEVEQKYNEIRRSVYVKRNDIIKSIPDFWLTAFVSHPFLSDLLTEEDQKIFKHLELLEVEDNKDLKSGYSYSIVLNFSENPYFEDRILTKTYSFSEEGTTIVNATTIKWKEGMNITNGVAHETQEKKKGNKRQLVEENHSFFTWFNETTEKKKGNKRQLVEENPSFFTWFNEITDKRQLVEENQSFITWFNQTTEKVEAVQDKVAEIIKADLWPNPLKYFNNVRLAGTIS